MIYVLNRHNQPFEVMTSFDTNNLDGCQIFQSLGGLADAFNKGNKTNRSCSASLLIVTEEIDNTLTIMDTSDNFNDSKMPLIEFLEKTNARNL